MSTIDLCFQKDFPNPAVVEGLEGGKSESEISWGAGLQAGPDCMRVGRAHTGSSRAEQLQGEGNGDQASLPFSLFLGTGLTVGLGDVFIG